MLLTSSAMSMSDDNFATLDITMNDINVSFFERKGDQLGSTYKIVF